MVLSLRIFKGLLQTLYIKNQKLRTPIFRTFKFRTKFDCNISRTTFVELILRLVKNTFTCKLIYDTLSQIYGSRHQLKAFEISEKRLSEI